MNGILLGILIDLLAGTVVCARYLRQGIPADAEPSLKGIEYQLDSLQAEHNLATTTHLADLSGERLERFASRKEASWPMLRHGATRTSPLARNAIFPPWVLAGVGRADL